MSRERYQQNTATHHPPDCLAHRRPGCCSTSLSRILAFDSLPLLPFLSFPIASPSFLPLAPRPLSPQLLFFSQTWSLPSCASNRPAQKVRDTLSNPCLSVKPVCRHSVSHLHPYPTTTSASPLISQEQGSTPLSHYAELESYVRERERERVAKGTLEKFGITRHFQLKKGWRECQE